MVPIITVAGIQLASLLGGVIVVEVLFAWPGLGRLTYDAVLARDYTVVQGAVLLVLLAAAANVISHQVDMRQGFYERNRIEVVHESHKHWSTVVEIKEGETVWRAGTP